MVLGPSNRNCACKARLDFELGPALRVVSAPVTARASLRLCAVSDTFDFTHTLPVVERAPRCCLRAVCSPSI